MPRSTLSKSSLQAAMRRLAPILGLVALPVAMWIVALSQVELAFDYRHFMYPQAQDLFHGNQPETAYPALATLLYALIALLPLEVGVVLISIGLVACALLTLWVLEVRDWRCYGAIFLWAPVYSAVQLGNVTLAFGLGIALIWRWRDHAARGGAIAAVLTAVKLFVWPLAAWLAATRRWSGVTTMVAIGVVATVAAFAVVGLDALAHLPDALRTNVTDNATKPFTIVAALRLAGGTQALAYAVCWAVGLGLLVLAVRVGLRGQERESLALTLGATLVLSPIVWLHYFALLLVPVALASPRFSWLWLAPLPTWIMRPVGGTLPEKVLMLVIAAVIVGYAAGVRVPRRAAHVRSATL